MMSKWQAGYESYWANVQYDPYADYAWREGWIAAQDDDYPYWF